MVVVVSEDDVHRAIDLLRTHGQRAVRIGTVSKGDGSVRFA
jgi:phosphoribosylaminoimidazole (AIR) synthetase